MELLERSVALEDLGAGVRNAAAGRGKLVAVTGPAGIGKTALIDTFVGRHCSGARVLSGVFDDLTTPRPLGPLVDMASSFGSELRELLASEFDVGRLFPLVIEELERPPRPVVLVLDDLQWGDQATMDLLVYVARRVARLPLLMVLSARDGAAPGLRRVLAAAGLGSTSEIELTPLSVAAVRELVGDRAPAIHARTGGVPFYVRALAEHPDDALPASVRDAVVAQVDRLPDGGRELLELLAVDPSGVGTRELDLVSPDWESTAVAAERAGMVVHTGEVVTFAHGLAREAIRQTLPSVRRRQLHRRVLAALGPDADVARVVHHARGAEDLDRLVPASLVAARAARHLHAHEQALVHYERLVPHLYRLADPSLRAAVAEEHAEELLAAGRPEDAVVALDDAIHRRRDLQQDREWGRLLARRASFLGQLGRHSEEGDALEAAFELLDDLEPGVELAHACIYRASHHLDGWHPHAARRDAERGLEIAEAVGAHDLCAYATIALGAAQAAAGEPETGLGSLAEAASLAAEIGHTGLVDTAHSERIEVLLDHHRLEAAEAVLDDALAHAEIHEHHGIHVRLTVQRSRLLLHRGDLHGALESADRASRTGSASPLVRWEARLQSAWARVRLGDPSSAASVAEVLRAAEGLPVRCRARATMLEAEHAWLHGRPADLDTLTSVHHRAVEAGHPWIAGDVARWLERHGGRADVGAATAAWLGRGDPYEAAMAASDSSERQVLLDALALADGQDARPLGELLRSRLRDLGVQRLPRGPRPTTRRNAAGLTERQYEVLGHLCEGRTNAQIAERLVLSQRTVENHVAAILEKLGVDSRGDAVLRATSLGLVGSAPEG